MTWITKTTWAAYEDLGDNPYQSLARPGGIDWAHAVKLARNIRDSFANTLYTAGLRDVPRVRVSLNGGKYEIEDGHHRVAACELLYRGAAAMREAYPGSETLDALRDDDFPGDERWAQVPVELIPLTDADLLRATMDSDLKKQLSPIGWARGWRALIEAEGLTQQEVAERYDVDQSTVANRLRLLHLPDAIQALIDGGTLTERHGRAMVSLAQHLPEVLAEYVELGGLHLWTSNGKERVNGEYVETRTVMKVNDTEARVRRVIARHTRNLTAGIDCTTVWNIDKWAPEQDPWLEDADLDEHPEHRRGACSACERAVKIGRDLRCLDIPCHKARYALYRLSRDHEHQHACTLAAEAARRRLFEDEPPAGTERLIITDVPGQQPGAWVAVFDHEDGSATVEAILDDLTEDQVIDVCETFYGDEFEYEARRDGSPSTTWRVEVPAHQVERQAQRERRDALFGSADSTYIVPTVMGKNYDRIKARVGIFDREDGSVEARAMKHDVANAGMFHQMCWDLTLKSELYYMRPGDVAEDGDTWVCTMTSRQASQPSPAPVVTVPPCTAGTVTPAAAAPSPEPAAPPANEPAPELQAELLATKSTWLRDPRYLTGEYLDDLFEIAQGVDGTLTGEQAAAIMANIERAMAHVQNITGKLITLAVAVEEAAPEGTFADSGNAAGSAAQAA
jgi:ParB-like chromosome segregation protein Spo0J